jgi:hypothetical protein
VLLALFGCAVVVPTAPSVLVGGVMATRQASVASEGFSVTLVLFTCSVCFVMKNALYKKSSTEDYADNFRFVRTVL